MSLVNGVNVQVGLPVFVLTTLFDWYEEYGWRVPPRQMPGGPILSSKRRAGESRRYRPGIGSVLNQIAFGAPERAATMSGQPSPSQYLLSCWMHATQISMG